MLQCSDSIMDLCTHPCYGFIQQLKNVSFRNTLGLMQYFEESRIEFADFAFERQKVACYGLQNNGGGATTVLNFPSRTLADSFHDCFLLNRKFEVFRNDAQIICLTDYERVMRQSYDDPRIRHLKYNRDFMMGTLEHLT